MVRNRNSGWPPVIRAALPAGLDVPTVIAQSFGAPDESFGRTQSLLILRRAYLSAPSSGVTVLASSGDNGTANLLKELVKNPAVIPFPTAGLSVPAGLGVVATCLARALATATRARPA